MLFLLFDYNLIYAQSTFSKIISNTDDQVINQICEDTEGNFVLVGRIKNDKTETSKGYILKIDRTGSSYEENIIQPIDTCSYIFFNIHFYNNRFYLLGSQMIHFYNKCKLWYLKLDIDLNVESEKTLGLPGNKWFSYMNSIIDSDTNIVLTGYTTRLDTNQNGGTFYNNDAFFYKLDLYGDSITSSFYNSENPWHFSFDIIENRDCSQYYAFVSHFTNIFGTSGQKLILNKSLDSLSIDSIPLQVFDFYSPTYISQDEILICGKRGEEPPNDYALNALTITESSMLSNYNIFKKDTFREHPALYRGTSKHQDNIYISATTNFDYINPFYSTNDSWFHLIKINPDITPKWEYWYGGDAYYQLYSIIATSDGGCLMVGNRYDYEFQDQERDVYVLKVDSSGLVVWTQEIQTDKILYDLYPNPGENQIHIKTTSEEHELELYNLDGQILIKQRLRSTSNTLNTESLPSGLYIYRFFDKEQKFIRTGKWIKK